MLLGLSQAGLTYSLGNGGLGAKDPVSELAPGEPGAPQPSPTAPGHHSRAIFHLDRAHPAQAYALADVGAVTQQPAAAALEVLLIPKREAGGRWALRGGAAHAAADRDGIKRSASREPTPRPGPPNPDGR